MSFTDVLSNAGRSFLRAFVASIVVYAPGILQAPDLSAMKSVGTAALVASLAAGLRALQDFIPALQVPGKFGDFIGSFARAAISAFVASVLGILEAPNLTITSGAIVAVITGALAAGALAAQKFLDKPASAPAPTT